MTIAEQIDSLRMSLPGCSLVAFGDVTTQLVLRSSQTRPIRREHLDQLCAEAGDCFSVIEAARTASQETQAGPESHVEAVVLAGSEGRIFVKSGRNESDFLCLVCERPFRATAIIASASETLDKIAAGQ